VRGEREELGTVTANGIRFRFIERGTGPLVLCLHGFPDNAHTFEHLLSALADVGFRAVAPFTRGYAPTGFPADGCYQVGALSQDVLALIDALGAGRCVVVGHDWGAAAGLGAAILAPQKVARLVTLAVNHPAANESDNLQYLKGIWHYFFFCVDSNAERVVAKHDFHFIEDLWREMSPDWEIPVELLEGVKQTFREPGVLQAALNYYRHAANPPDWSLEERVNTEVIPVPTLALHGTRDRPRRLECFQQMDRFFSGELEKMVVPDTGHFLHLEAPDVVNDRIVEFLLR
jgi:pimeloyl-ACP methyl ester carboxylesterase